MTPMIPRSRFFDEFFRDFPVNLSIRPLHGDPLPSPDKIRIDVKENGSNVIVNAEIPGVDKQDIDISIDNNVVTVKAEVKQYDAETEDEKVLHSERYFGSVERSFALPCPVDEAKAMAAYEHGILTLTLPKANPGGTKRIAVQ